MNYLTNAFVMILIGLMMYTLADVVLVAVANVRWRIEMLVPKFRAWDKDTKTMHNVVDIYLSTRTVSLRDMFGDTFPLGFNNVVLMQSTGLFDKTGVEIFEGDVLYYPENPEGERYGIVVWQKESLAFVLETAFDYLPYGFWAVGEVIGNIYENPELLEEME